MLLKISYMLTFLYNCDILEHLQNVVPLISQTQTPRMLSKANLSIVDLKLSQTFWHITTLEIW